MELSLNKDSTIKNVQEQFNAIYPFLQLQFFKPVPVTQKDRKRLEKALPELPLKYLSSENYPEKFVIREDTTVADLIQTLSEAGLIAALYRRSGSLWIETSLTDDWTLYRQNQEAKLISLPEEKVPVANEAKKTSAME